MKYDNIPWYIVSTILKYHFVSIFCHRQDQAYAICNIILTFFIFTLYCLVAHLIIMIHLSNTSKCLKMLCKRSNMSILLQLSYDIRLKIIPNIILIEYMWYIYIEFKNILYKLIRQQFSCNSPLVILFKFIEYKLYSW